jgi:hypothetical protein
VAARGARPQLSGLFARAMRRQRVIGVPCLTSLPWSLGQSRAPAAVTFHRGRRNAASSIAAMARSDSQPVARSSCMVGAALAPCKAAARLANLVHAQIVI